MRMDRSRNAINGFAASSKLGLPRARSGVDELENNENGVFLRACLALGKRSLQMMTRPIHGCIHGVPKCF